MAHLNAARIVQRGTEELIRLLEAEIQYFRETIRQAELVQKRGAQFLRSQKTDAR
jgi:hypothetical protein